LTFHFNTFSVGSSSLCSKSTDFSNICRTFWYAMQF
jgi:hypothetical protein